MTKILVITGDSLLSTSPYSALLERLIDSLKDSEVEVVVQSRDEIYGCSADMICIDEFAQVEQSTEWVLKQNSRGPSFDKVKFYGSRKTKADRKRDAKNRWR